MKEPDTRFNQLISNLQWEYSSSVNHAYKEEVYRKEEKNFYTIYEKHWRVDLYSVEDDEFIAFLEGKLKEEDDNGQT